tara:strand:- start:2486 stop:3190 length:705 start_codon:yes stop_codon:yes gene_type:complete
MIYFLGLLALLSCDVGVSGNQNEVTIEMQKAINYGNRGLKRSYESAVKLVPHHDGIAIGEASGGYFIYNGTKFILTAAHVVADADVVKAKERYGIGFVDCKVAYVNEHYDIAVIVPQAEFKTQKPLKYTYDYAMKRGEPLYFTGYPGEMEEITMHGSFAGNAGEFYLLQSAAWLGSSGSPVFDSKGRVIGVISGIVIGWTPFGTPQLVNNMVVVSPMYSISENHLKSILKDAGL